MSDAIDRITEGAERNIRAACEQQAQPTIDAVYEALSSCNIDFSGVMVVVRDAIVNARVREMDPLNPRWDHDTKVISIATHDDDGNADSINFELRRGISGECKDRPGWRLANFSMVGTAVQSTVTGLSTKDCRRLSEFFADYSERLRDY